MKSRSDNHLLVQLKRNQPLLYEAMVEHTRHHPFVDEARTHEIGQRNRIEDRIAHIWHLPPGVGPSRGTIISIR